MPSPRQYTSKDESGTITKTKIYSCNSFSTAARIVRENGMKVVKKGERENANPEGNAIRVLRASKKYKIHKKDTSASKEAAEKNPFFIWRKEKREEYDNGTLSCGEIVEYTSTEGVTTDYIVGAGGFVVKANKQGKKQQKKQKTGQQTKQQQQKQQQQTKQQKQQTTTKKKTQPVATRASGRPTRTRTTPKRFT